MSTDQNLSNSAAATEARAAKERNLERIRSRQTVTVFVRENSDGNLAAYTSSTKSESESAYVLKRLSLDRLSPELRSGYQSIGPDEYEAVLVATATQNREARDQLDAYRREKGLTARPDEDFTPVIARLPLYIRAELLRLAMLDPTLEEVGGVEGIPDIEPVLFGFINAGFKQTAVDDQPISDLTGGDAAIVEAFREPEAPAVSRPGSQVRETAALLGPTETKEPSGVPPEPLEPA